MGQVKVKFKPYPLHCTLKKVNIGNYPKMSPNKAILTCVTSEALFNVLLIGDTNAIGRSKRQSGVALIGDFLCLFAFDLISRDMASRFCLYFADSGNSGVMGENLLRGESISVRPKLVGFLFFTRCVLNLGSWFSFTSMMCTRGLFGN